MFYDPMIAKLITYGDDRDAAIDTMREALDDYYVRGLNHNLAFLSHLVAHPRFRSGAMTTNFIAEEYPDGLSPEHLTPTDPKILAAAAAVIELRAEARNRGIGGNGATRKAPHDLTVFIGEEQPEDLTLHVHEGADADRVTFADGSEIHVASDWKPGQPLFEARIDDAVYIVQIDLTDSGYVLSHAGTRALVRVVESRIADLQRFMPYKPPPDMSKFLLSPMPGLLVRLSVEEGQTVKAGAELAVVEAMKMENVLRAASDGTVAALHAGAGDSLAVDQKILEFE